MRFLRIGKMLTWLGQLGIQLHKLEHIETAQRQKLLQQMALRGLQILNVRVDTLPFPTERGTLVVANHVSWLDIFAITAYFPSGFIAMKEIKSWFVLGKITTNAGTVFIDRNNRKDIDPINAAIAQRLQKGDNVCFFPEARTSLGNGVLPLKAALFQAAIDAQAPIQPLALRYYDDGMRTEDVSFANANFFVSLWRIVSIPEIVLKMDCADVIEPTANDDRFALKEQVEMWLKARVLSDSPNPERLLPAHK